jgi:CheY-like chemotaxis protein
VPLIALLPRILLIEDDAGRIESFTRWLAGTEFVLVVARSGGQALGMLAKGSTEAVAGILLDHDLSDSPLTQTDCLLSASNVIPLIQRRVRPSVPVLIHSHNTSKPVRMQRALEATGFSVTRIRFATLAQSDGLFGQWLQDVRVNWDPED